MTDKLFDIPTGDLLEELMSRFDHCMFSGWRPPKKANAKVGGQYIRRWKGNVSTVVGMMEITKHIITEDFLENCVDIEPGGAFD